MFLLRAENPDKGNFTGKVAKLVSHGPQIRLHFFNEKLVYLFKEHVYTYQKIYVLDHKHVINCHCLAEWYTNIKYYMGILFANIEASTVF